MMEKAYDSHSGRIAVILLIAVFMALFVLLCGTAMAADMPEPADAKLVSLILPEHELIYGVMDGYDKMLLLMKNPEKELVFVGDVYDEQEWNWIMTESTPLPEGTVLGVENFTHSLGIPIENGYYYAVDVSPFADGSWGVTMFYPGHAELFQAGKNWLSSGVWPMEDGFVCNHPWADITKIDWTSLPKTFDEAQALVNCEGWAVVNNANPAERLNLREKADAASGSIGKYYNGTPVRVISRSAVWTEVDVLGVHGYMMTKYLAFGEAIRDVEFAGRILLTQENAEYLTVYDAVHEHGTAKNVKIDSASGFYVVGVLWDEWYHMWFYDLDMGGYVHQNALWEGNG